MKPAVANPLYRVLCLRIVPKIGSSIYLTHHPRDLVMSSHIYLSTSGYDFTGYSAGATMSPSMIDLEGIAGLAGIGYDQINSGVFDGAHAYLFATTWNNPVEDEEPIVASFFGKTTLMDGVYKVEEMSFSDALNQSVGKTYTASCSKTFGGQEYAGCKIDLGPYTITGTISSVTNAYQFLVSNAQKWNGSSWVTEVADWYGAGTIQFTTGANAGLKPIEIKRHSIGGDIETYEPLYYLPSVGDTYLMIPGCRKRLEDCRDKYNNVINADFFLWIPLGSVYAQVGSS